MNSLAISLNRQAYYGDKPNEDNKLGDSLEMKSSENKINSDEEYEQLSDEKAVGDTLKNAVDDLSDKLEFYCRRYGGV